MIFAISFNEFTQTNYPRNGQNLLIEARVFLSILSYYRFSFAQEINFLVTVQFKSKYISEEKPEVVFPCHLKTSEKQRFTDVSRGYGDLTSELNELIEG